MNWAWASSLEQIWRSPAFPMWLTLAAAGFFGITGAAQHALPLYTLGDAHRISVTWRWGAPKS